MLPELPASARRFLNRYHPRSRPEYERGITVIVEWCISMPQAKKRTTRALRPLLAHRGCRRCSSTVRSVQAKAAAAGPYGVLVDDEANRRPYAAEVPPPGPKRPKGLRTRKHRCPTCRGTGQMLGMTKAAGSGLTAQSGTCPDCDGIGWLSN